MTKDEIKTVLDAMNYAISPSGTFWVKKHNEAKQILTAALAEQSEAVAEVAGDYNTKHIIFLPAGIALEVGEKLFTHPAPSKPLESDKDFCQAIAERDEYHDMADKLAEGQGRQATRSSEGAEETCGHAYEHGGSIPLYARN